jgi:hypothetical protein
MNLVMARKLALQEYALGAAAGMEDEKLDLLRNWMGGIDRLEAKANAAANAPPPAPPGGLAPGMGVGAPPPVSPMLPPAGTAPLGAP